MSLRIAARWIYPVTSVPIESGSIVVEGNRIAEISKSSSGADLDLGNFAIIPGLVNAHTHLDLSHVPLIPVTFDSEDDEVASLPKWLLQVISQRRQTTPEQTQAAIQAGLEESMRYGVTALCDISVGGASYDILKDAPIRSVVCNEILGLNPAKIDEIWDACQKWLQLPPSGNAVRGISPHAPYSTHKELLKRAGAAGVPLAIHFAESPEEQKLLENREGEFVDFLKTLGVWHPDGLANSFDEVQERVTTSSKKLLVHVNHVPKKFTFEKGQNVVYCPRTYAMFNREPYPMGRYDFGGLNVCLGTDSRASSPDLDLFAEMQFAARQFGTEFHHYHFLGSGTYQGAAAMGIEKDCGSLEVGKWADFVALSLPKGFKTPDRLLFAKGVGQTRYTMFNGEWRGAIPPT